jgi:hypothetical protein
MRARRERNKRGPIASRHADTKSEGESPVQDTSASVAEPVSDSVNAGVSAGGNAGVNTGVPAVDEPVAEPKVEPAGPVAQAAATVGESAGVSAGANAEPGGQAKPKRPPRRAGRPRGPERAALSVRILAHLDERLTEEVERQGLNPQTIVDQALTEHFGRLDRARQRAAGVSAGGNDGENAG